MLKIETAGITKPSAVAGSLRLQAVGELGRDVQGRLDRIALGATVDAVLGSRFTDGSFQVELSRARLPDGSEDEGFAGASMRMQMPAGTQTGQRLALTLVAREPRPTFLLDAPNAADGGVQTRLSAAGRLVDSLLAPPAAEQGQRPQALVQASAPLQPSSAAPAPALAASLAQALDNSGLFYEAHVAQWAEGRRSLSQLRAEPQFAYTAAQLRADATAQAAGSFARAQPERDAAPGTALAADLRRAASQAAGPVPARDGDAAKGGKASGPAAHSSMDTSVTPPGEQPEGEATRADGFAPAQAPQDAATPRPADKQASSATSAPPQASTAEAQAGIQHDIAAESPEALQTAAHPADQPAHQGVQLEESVAGKRPAADMPARRDSGTGDNRPAAGDGPKAGTLPGVNRLLSAALLALPEEASTPPAAGAPSAPSDGAGVDAGSEAAQMIRMQLDTLEHRQLFWRGQAWPGMEMEWAVAEGGGGKAGAVERSWQSVLRMHFDHLGTVTATISLTGKQMQVSLRAATPGVAERLRQDAALLASAMEAAGTPLHLLTVREENAS